MLNPLIFEEAYFFMDSTKPNSYSPGQTFQKSQLLTDKESGSVVERQIENGKLTLVFIDTELQVFFRFKYAFTSGIFNDKCELWFTGAEHDVALANSEPDVRSGESEFNAYFSRSSSQQLRIAASLKAAGCQLLGVSDATAITESILLSKFRE